MRTSFILLATLALALGSITAAEAQDRRAPGNVRVYAGPGFGFGGELETEAKIPFLGNRSLDTDLATTFGFQVGADFVLHRYIAVGLEYRFGAYNTEQGDDDDVKRSKMHDFAFKPRARYAFDELPLELYLTVPVGLTIARFSDEVLGEDQIDERVGWNIGAGGGATYFIASRFGINVEPIWLMHRFKADGDVLGVDYKFTTKQFNLLFNGVLAF